MVNDTAIIIPDFNRNFDTLTGTLDRNEFTNTVANQLILLNIIFNNLRQFFY